MFDPALKQKIYDEWVTPIPTGNEETFKKLLNEVFDPHIQWPVTTRGFMNGVGATDANATDVVEMLFYMVNMAGILKLQLLHAPTGEVMEFTREATKAAQDSSAATDYQILFSPIYQAPI